MHEDGFGRVARIGYKLQGAAFPGQFRAHKTLPLKGLEKTLSHLAAARAVLVEPPRNEDARQAMDLAGLDVVLRPGMGNGIDALEKCEAVRQPAEVADRGGLPQRFREAARYGQADIEGTGQAAEDLFDDLEAIAGDFTVGQKTVGVDR